MAIKNEQSDNIKKIVDDRAVETEKNYDEQFKKIDENKEMKAKIENLSKLINDLLGRDNL